MAVFYWILSCIFLNFLTCVLGGQVETYACSYVGTHYFTESYACGKDTCYRQVAGYHTSYQTCYRCKPRWESLPNCDNTRCSGESDSSFCFPGTCPGYTTSCTCHSGFGGSNCLSIYEKPQLSYCLAVLHKTAGDEKVESKCESDQLLYTSLTFNKVNVEWNFIYNTNAMNINRPGYITDFGIGIVSSYAAVYRNNNLVGQQSCLNVGDSNPGKPNIMYECKSTIDYSHEILHGDRFKIVVYNKNGGFVKFRADSTQITSTNFYLGSSIQNTVEFLIDKKAPFHCSLLNQCADKMLDLGLAVTKMKSINLKWEGWMDSDSGIKQYEYAVYLLSDVGGQLTVIESNRVAKGNLTGNSYNLDLPSRGVYCVLLTVDDKAGNYERARRFLIYDNESNVENDSRYEMKVLNGLQTEEKQSFWIESLQENIRVSWKNHFINKYHVQNTFLAPIKPHSPPISNGYEETTGIPPQTRSMEKIPNINGIVKILVGHKVDSHGRENVTAPISWTSITKNEFDLQEKSFQIPRKDGDAIRIWVRAIDVVDSYLDDFVTVYADSSPPAIQDISLRQRGSYMSAIHHSEDLKKMKLSFVTFDDHSGLKHILCELHDSENPDVIHAKNYLSVQKVKNQSNCIPPFCGCTLDGLCYKRNYEADISTFTLNTSAVLHNYDYYFIIKVTNNANLEYRKSFQIMIDDTPPYGGIIKDGLPGKKDVNYQQEFKLHASWSGFYDKESGITFYQYIFDHSCANKTVFGLKPNIQVKETTNLYAYFETSSPGTYYATVVAFNGALETSDPVCTDGVTIDITPPHVSQIILENNYVHSGLLLDNKTNQLWYVDNQRYRFPVNISHNCKSKALIVNNIEDWPEGIGRKLLDKSCLYYGATSDIIFIHTLSNLNISWKIEDNESGMYDCEIGLGSTEFSLNPDILPYTSTKGHSNFFSHHPNLEGSDRFFLYIKAINKARKEHIKILGPLIVVTTPPVFNGSINVKYVEVAENGYLRITWNQAAFTSREFSNDNGHYEFSIGLTEGGTEFTPFTSLDEFHNFSNICDNIEFWKCFAFPVNDLNWNVNGKHQYYVSIKFINHAGLSTVGAAEPYYHDVVLPHKGIVHEIKAATINESFPADIDYLSSFSSICIFWFNFANDYEEISYYEVGLGSNIGLTDMSPFINVSAITNKYQFTNLSLEPFKKYYATVKAVNKVGTVKSTSDGVLILPDSPEILQITVNDGLGCVLSANRTTTKYLEPFIQECQDDLDYQISLSTISAHWIIPEYLKIYFTNVLWAAERFDQNKWVMIRDFENLHSSTFISTTINLEDKTKYRSAIKLCHPDGCSKIARSKGFQTLHHHPLPPTVTELKYNLTSNSIIASWVSSYESREALSEIIYYEWSVISTDGGILIPWERISPNNAFHESLKEKLSIHSPLCKEFILRTYNKVGLFSTTTKAFPDCKQKSIDLELADAVGTWDFKKNKFQDVYLAKNSFWTKPDEEYTPHSSSLSAVWPRFKHPTFAWKVLSDHNRKTWTYIKEGHKLSYEEFSCRAFEVLKCGTTKDNFINVHDLTLKHGERYYICIYANSSKLQYETFEEVLPELSACTNGIVVDLTAPLPGKVTLDLDNQLQYQISTSEVSIRWTNFVDLEEHGYTDHISGIKSYQVALGTTFGGVDIKDFVEVGNVNHVILHGLQLQKGQNYFASVKATDFVGLSTIAVSNKFVIDYSPPELNNISINLGGPYHQSLSILGAEWNNVFFDKESGIIYFDWCIGSLPYICDIASYRRTTEQNGEIDVDLLEGHIYHVTVKAYNGAGLSTVASSLGIIVDASPPVTGVVVDGNKSVSEIDTDYQISLTTLSSHWTGFYDPHTPIHKYIISIGTCVTCSDVVEEINIGMQTEMHWTSLNLIPGQKYYVSVKACNAANLCSIASSDGIIADNSPPKVGLVFDGIRDGDINWQKSRDWLAAHWFNFEDVHSGILYYERRAGTMPGGDNVLKKSKVFLNEEAFAVREELAGLLPVNETIYITVTATNKAGLSSEKISDGFKIDSTPPLIESAAEIDYSQGSLVSGTQYWSSNLKVSWEFKDPESSVLYQLISLLTPYPSLVELPTIKVSGSFKNYQFTNLSLDDGELYFVRIIGCNSASLCSVTESSHILIDTSAPITGSFTGANNFTSNVVWHNPDWMIYEQNSSYSSAKLKLAWLGFSDPHSDIKNYYISVGSYYRGWDLTNIKSYKISHQNFELEYYGHNVQTAVIEVNRNLLSAENIYIYISAENGVGLKSPVVHSSFLIVPSNDHEGLLEFIRRCEIQTCERHCTCAARGQFCSTDSTANCTNVIGNYTYQHYEVYDVVNIKNKKDTNFTSSKCSLAAVWTDEKYSLGLPAISFEWSVGIKDLPPGSGIFDVARDQIWFDSGLNREAVLAQGISTSGFSLGLKRNYVFYVRAWYDQNRYAIFQSDGVLVDYTPPTTKARKVREVKNETTSDDIDYVTDSSSLIINWKNVFSDAQTRIVYYFVGLSTFPGGDNVVPFMKVESPVTCFTFKNLSLQTGIKYFSNIIAVNEAGLHSEPASSDGVMVDVDKPEPGVVWDGIQLHDLKYQNQTTLLAASWHGFSDSHSFIHHYLWCVGSLPGKHDISFCSDVGLKQAVTKVVEPILHQKYYSSVYAVDAAGLVSFPGISNGVIIDKSPPRALRNIAFNQNILKNPSFENNTLEFWDTKGTVAIMPSTPDFPAISGDYYLNVFGRIKQSFTLSPGVKYCFSFYTSFHDQNRTGILSQEGFIKTPESYLIFTVGKSDQRLWHKHHFYIIATERMSYINIGSANPRSGFLIDNIAVQQITYNNDTSNDSPVFVHLNFVNRQTSIHASWEIDDPESGIMKYLWAIGTVRGGIQLQPFTSVGRMSFAENTKLILTHRTFLHVTVVAINNAELSAAFYSQPMLIDLTPPEIFFVKDGKPNEDKDYFSTDEISCHWHALDKESDYFCYWALGNNPGGQDVYPFSSKPSDTGSIKLTLPHGSKIYCTVFCKNVHGLESRKTSGGAIVVTKFPSSEEGIVKVIVNSPSHYPARNNHQTNNTAIDFYWSGFKDESGIKSYQIKVSSIKLGDVTKWLSTGNQCETYALLEGLNLLSYHTYQVYVRAVNKGGLISGVAYANVSIEVDLPLFTGNKLTIAWPGVNLLKLSWFNMFISNSNLIYEVSIVSRKTRQALLQWYKTQDTEVIVKDVDRIQEYQVSITAINEAGNYLTQRYDVMFGKDAILE